MRMYEMVTSLFFYTLCLPEGERLLCPMPLGLCASMSLGLFVSMPLCLYVAMPLCLYAHT